MNITIEAGRHQAGDIMGFLRRILLSCVYVETESVPTMAVDSNWRCYVNPTFAGAMKPRGVAIVLAHEALHLMLDHGNRYQAFAKARGWTKAEMLANHTLWNSVCDAIINGMLLAAGVTLKEWAGAIGKKPCGQPLGVFPSDFGMTNEQVSAMTAEELFVHIQNKEEEEPQGPDPQTGPQGEPEDDGESDGDSGSSESEGDSGDESGGGASDGDGEAEGEGGGSGGEPDDEESEGGGSASDGESGEAGESGGASDGDGDPINKLTDLSSGPFGGSCSDGIERDYEDKPDGSEVSKPAAESIRKAVLDNAKEWSGGRGVGGADMELVWEALNEEPVIDWKSEVQQFVSEAGLRTRGSVDFTYAEVSVLQPVFEPLVPVMDKPNPKVWVGVDTSGSMFGELNHTVNEAKDILDAVEVPVRWITCDNDVVDHGEITCAEDITLVGGGGTDMRDLLSYIDGLCEEGDAPDAVVLFTDCETPWPAVAPDYEVLIVDVRPGGSYGQYPEWGESVLACPKV